MSLLYYHNLKIVSWFFLLWTTKYRWYQPLYKVWKKSIYWFSIMLSALKVFSPPSLPWKELRKEAIKIQSICKTFVELLVPLCHIYVQFANHSGRRLKIWSLNFLPYLSTIAFEDFQGFIFWSQFVSLPLMSKWMEIC